jgi:glycerol-3-phosphate dehydrogenase
MAGTKRIKMDRQKSITRLSSETFDLCIIGGGASGAGCALDAASRGLKVALIEKSDFAAETSSKSTKLIHGGVRYLEQAFTKLDFAQLRQVKHGLEERHIVLSNAPHLARPLALITPVFTWIEGLYFTIGLTIYSWFASGRDTLPKSMWLSKADVLRRLPGLSPRLHSGVLYYDGQLDDARYCLALAQSAAEAGAVVVNHLAVTGFERDADGKLSAAYLADERHPEQAPITVRAKVFLNCTGAHADHIRLMANPAQTPRIRPSKGVHLVLSGDIMPGKDALLIPKTRDGRVVFSIPFEGHVLLGTTDDDYTALDQEPILEAAEVDFLLETLQRYAAKTLSPTMVLSGFGGLRPLIAATGSTKGLVRDHEVEHDPASNLFSLLGGKWTTYRLMAKDAIDEVCALLGNTQPCTTDTHVLTGGANYRFEDWADLQRETGWDTDICQNLLQKYGSRYRAVADLALKNPELAHRVHPRFPYLCAEVVYSAQHEMAVTIRDFLARRVRLEISDWAATIEAAPIVGQHLGQTLGWTAAEQAVAVQEYVALVEGFQQRMRKL